jgi:hypothetical protein
MYFLECIHINVVFYVQTFSHDYHNMLWGNMLRLLLVKKERVNFQVTVTYFMGTT